MAFTDGLIIQFQDKLQTLIAADATIIAEKVVISTNAYKPQESFPLVIITPPNGSTERITNGGQNGSDIVTISMLVSAYSRNMGDQTAHDEALNMGDHLRELLKWTALDGFLMQPLDVVSMDLYAASEGGPFIWGISLTVEGQIWHDRN